MGADSLPVDLPAPMWLAMKPLLERDLLGLSSQQRQHRQESGPAVSIRLRDGKVKRWVEVDWDGRIKAELYEEYGVRAEKVGPPRFTTDDIESWGSYERVWQPTWSHPIKKVWLWNVRVWADGRLGEPATQ